MKIHTLGFPRIGSQRELKKAQEAFWKGSIEARELEQVAESIQLQIQREESSLDFLTTGDFSLYDHVLDMSFTLGNIPERVKSPPTTELDYYFRSARGRSAEANACCNTHAGEMTKWFDTNYHYIVPEFSEGTEFKLNTDRLDKALTLTDKSKAKVMIIGPVTYLWLGKSKDGSDKYALLKKLIPIYKKLLQHLKEHGVEWVQIDEPALVMDLEPRVAALYKPTYDALAQVEIKLLLTTYFGALEENLDLALELPVAGLHLDIVCSQRDLQRVFERLPQGKVLSLGVINGRNIWKSDLNSLLEFLEPIYKSLGERLWLAPSCSLLHVPVDLQLEEKMDSEVKSWLAFALQKLEELRLLKQALTEGRNSVAEALQQNQQCVESRHGSTRVNNPKVRQRLQQVTPEWGNRKSPYNVRTTLQREKLTFPLYPTTTIGSFPQTKEIRSLRSQYRKGTLSEVDYRKGIQKEICSVINIQEELGLDVLVHGEAERNDMVEYFGEQLQGYVFSEYGWVQSYGSRCVKPPILFGDISRPQPMTIDWITFAQSQTQKPMKGMLTGPVTILNWSFVRDDQPKSETCLQLALAIRDEVQDLEKAGIAIIQIDEAALREGLPLRKADWQTYLDWSIRAYRVAANGVADKTQIHTHMCYSEFNDIIEAIAGMDADVITIETSRSDMELLDVFDTFQYPNEIGPGVYDIHSPNVPSVDSIIMLIEKAEQRIPAERLWINPDCGLKTRAWPETKASLRNMVAAAHSLRRRKST